MLKKASVFLALATITGCETYSTVSNFAYRPNTTIAQKDRHSFDCEVEANRKVPTNTQVRSTPGYVTPVYTSCYGYSCTSTGGQTVGGGTYSYDTNSDLRFEYMGRCLQEKGYTIVSVPTCLPGRVPESLASQLTGKLRRPTEGSCAFKITQRASNIVYANELSQ